MTSVTWPIFLIGFQGGNSPRADRLLPFTQFLQLLPQPAKSPHQTPKISAVNHPGSNVSGEEKLDCVHRELRVSGRLALAATPDPTSDSMA